MAPRIEIGDWVQAKQEITEPGFMDCELWIHALRGGVGHVQAVDGEWATVTWERTGTTTDCHLSELDWLCHADLGKDLAASGRQKRRNSVRSQITDLKWTIGWARRRVPSA